MLKFGTITSINPLTARARVSFIEDNMTSFWLPVLQNKTFKDKFYSMLDVGEQVACKILTSSKTYTLIDDTGIWTDVCCLSYGVNGYGIKDGQVYYIKISDGTTTLLSEETGFTAVSGDSYGLAICNGALYSLNGTRTAKLLDNSQTWVKLGGSQNAITSTGKLYYTCLMDEHSEDGVILGAIYTTEDTPKSKSEKEISLRLEDNSLINIDKTTGTLTINFKNIQINGDINQNGKLINSLGISSDSDISDKISTMQAMRDTYNSHMHSDKNIKTTQSM